MFSFATGYEPGEHITLTRIMTSFTTVQIPKLMPYSYDSWTTKIKMLLIREKFWSVVCQLKVRPDGGSEDKPTEAQVEYDEEVERATATIFLYLSDDTERPVLEITDPVELWEKLKVIYTTTGFTTCFLIWWKLFGSALGAQKSVKDYVNHIRTCGQALKDTACVFPEGILSSVLLNGLGSGYETFVAFITQAYCQLEGNKFGELVAQILDEEKRQEDAELGYLKKKDMAMVARTWLTCWYCKRPGYKEETC